MTRRPLHSSPPSNNANNANNTQNADDAVIGRAFWWSLAVFALVASGIGIVFWLDRQTVETPLPVEADYVPPQAEQTVVDIPRLPFTDVTLDAGIDFVHVNGAYGDKLLPETMGGGCAFFDFDKDGDQDLLFVNASV
jgi:hypothetical protein